MPCPIKAGCLIGVIRGMALATANELSKGFVGFFMMTFVAGNADSMEAVGEFDLVDPTVEFLVALWTLQYNLIRDLVGHCR